MTKKSSYQDFISKPEMSFWVPIVFSAFTIALSWASVFTKVELLNQKVDNLTAQIQILTDKYANVESRYGTISLKVQRLETTVGIEK